MISNYVLICTGISITTSVLTWFLCSKKFKSKIREYTSLDKAIDSKQMIRDELEKENNDLKAKVKSEAESLSKLKKETEELTKLKERADEIANILKDSDEKIASRSKLLSEKTKEQEDLEISLHELKSDIDLYNAISDFIDYGIYEDPEYLFETSERYQVELKRIRDKQKELIKNNQAIELPNDIQVDGSSKKGSSVLADQAKLMLHAFNLECDYLFSKLNPSNFARTMERIDKIVESLEKSAISLMCGFSIQYVKLKYDECRLQYEYVMKRKQEDDENALKREQIKEEEKARRDFEKAMAEAEKEERIYERLIEKARAELSSSGGSVRAELEGKIAVLEEQLKEAKEKGERAKSMAEQTKKGYVYIISNIGSFGEDVYKIGLTRRLDPMDRVKELGDASVPFQFDVHAIVYSDDSPALEAELHRRFKMRRLNMVNFRKEYFKANLSEIETAIKELVGQDVEIRKSPIAKEYFESLRLLGSSLEEQADDNKIPK